LKTIAIYPGSFDPITLGHWDIIERAAKMFDHVVIGIGINPDKDPFFSVEERINLIDEGILPNVDVESYSGLTIHFAEKFKKPDFSVFLIRGIRDFADLQSEMHIARLNRRLSGIETMFLTPSDSHLVTSSTIARQIWECSGNGQLLVDLVPKNVIEAFESRKK
jgi:pantetheine-phosphate adenylyltransferase